MKKFLVITLISFISVNIFPQKIGEWNTLFSYSADVEKIVQAEDNLFVLTDGKLFSYDSSDEYMEMYHKENGDDIIKIEYSRKYKCLIVVRKNSDIDLIYSKDRSTNIPDLKNMTINLDNTVNDIFVNEDFAYISTNFGLLILNLIKEEVKESVLFRYPVYSTCIHDNKLYAATENGTRRIDISGYIQDPDSWESIALSDTNTDPANYQFSDSEIIKFVSFDNRLFFIVKSQFLYNYDGSKVEQMTYVTNPVSMHITNNRLIVSQNYTLWIFSDSGNYQSIYRINEDLFTYVLPDKDLSNEFWVGLANKNLSKIKISTENRTYEYLQTGIKPDGPVSNFPFSMIHEQGNLFVAGGDMDAARRDAQLSELKDKNWMIFEKQEIDDFSGKDVKDFVSVAVDPKDPGHVFAASWLNGLYEFQDGKITAMYDANNSPLENAYSNPYETSCRVIGLYFDSNGTLWMQNSNINEGASKIRALTSEKKWYTMSYSPLNSQYGNSRSIIIDRYSNYWAYGYPYILVFNTNNTLDVTSDDRVKLVSSFYDQDGSRLTITNIYCLTEDKSGNIWVGTNAGIFVIYGTYQVFDRDMILNKIKIPRDDGSGNVDILLRDVRINDIKVDGGNRKWVATELGLYVVSHDGLETVHHFTMENSLLPSDNIMSLAIDPLTGVVYIGSDKGIVSYNGEAIEGVEGFSNVYAYPNPVRPEYEGIITVTGLQENSTIKITDVRGNLIHEGTSIGGRYLWDGRNARRERVETGVYLVFGSSEDGKKGVVTKIMMIKD